jgi:TolB-like protein
MKAMSEITSVPSTHAGSSTQENVGDQGETDKRKKKAKVRSAWISFVGRIVAQLFGAVATVMLGLQVVQRYIPPADEQNGSPIEQTVPAPAPVRPPGLTVLAVLPVANYSNDPGQDAFTDGLTEALIAEFAVVPGLSVTSRTSSMHFREQRGLLRTIARQLGVDIVLEASVVRAHGRTRVIAQLIDASTDLHIMARRYDFADDDVLTLHSAVAGAVVRDVRTSGIGTDAHRASRSESDSSLAQE